MTPSIRSPEQMPQPSANLQGRREAAAAVWNWRAKKPTGPDPATVRARGVRQGLIIGAVSVTLWLLHFGHLWKIAAFFSALNLVLATVSPLQGYALLQKFEAGLTHWVGVVLTYLVIVPAWLLFFIPGSLMRKGKPDEPMRRRWLPEARTYWQTRTDDASSAERLERPF